MPITTKKKWVRLSFFYSLVDKVKTVYNQFSKSNMVIDENNLFDFY